MTIDIPDDPSLGSGCARSVPPRFPFFPVRPGRRWGASAAACLLALGLALQLGAGTVEAQTSVKLVGNTSATSAGNNMAGDNAQQFRTGSRDLGYRLKRVDLTMRDGTGTLPSFTVKIHSDSSGSPGTSLGTLTRQDSLPSTAGLVQFTASGTGIDLDANTEYWVVVDVTNDPSTNHKIHTTTSGSEDANPSAGWSVADTSRWRFWGASAWNAPNNESLHLAIHGHGKGFGPSLTGYTVTDKTLKLTFDSDLMLVVSGIGDDPDPQLLARLFTVKVAGRRARVAGVAMSGKTVTLTLARPVGANQAVTVSFDNAGTPLQSTSNEPVADFTDQPVTVGGSNNAPVYTDSTEATDGFWNAPPNAFLATLRIPRSDFSDPDTGDTLTLSISASRDNVLVTGGSWPADGLDYLTTDGRLFVQIKNNCRLENIRPALPQSFDTIVTVTATDPTGAAAHADVILRTGRELNVCPAFSSASVTDRALTLMFEGHPDQAAITDLPASAFEVKVAGQVVPLADTDPVTIGTPTTAGGRKTTPVTLTLARPVGAGQSVTVSHVPYDDDPSTTQDDLETVAFTDEAVTVSSTNNAPTITPGNPLSAPPGIAVYVPVEDQDTDTFSDDHPSADLKLHVTWTTDRPDLLNAENAGYLDHSGQFYLRMPGECELAQVKPKLPALFDTTVEITAEDPTGAVARGTVLAQTAWDGGVECPGLAAAVVDGNTLTLYYSVELDGTSTPPANRFTVKAGGTAVDLAATSPVAVDGNQVVLTLAGEVTAGARVTVSYAPPVFGGIQRTIGTFPNDKVYAALELTDHPVTNVAGDTRNPVLRGAWVVEDTLTLVYDEPLHPDHTASPSNFSVEEVHENGADRIYVSEVKVIGKRVVLALQRAVNPDRMIGLTYQPIEILNSPALLQDFAGNIAPGIGHGDEGRLEVNHGSPPPERAPTPPSGGGGPGGGGSPVDTAPDFGTATVAPLSLARGEAMDPVVLPRATGGDRDLTYTLSSAPAGLAGLSFDAATRRLSGTPDTAGDYGFTYTAHDADANRADTDAAVLTFTVTVEDSRTAMVRQSVRRTLSAVARRSLTSALDNIGARFAASVPGPSLTLAGETVPLGAIAGSGDAEQYCLPGATDSNGTNRGDCAFVTRGMTSEELLHASSFTLTLGAAENTGNTGTTDTPPSPQWAVWGRGDLGTFAGRPEPGMGYEGELRTGWLGVDARAGAWVMGLALSHGTGEADYDFTDGGVSGQGRLETSLTALYPYGRWTLSEGLEVRGVLGAGSGEARHRLDDGAGGGNGSNERSDLSMWMGSLGLRRAFPSLGEIDLAARADASLARMETGDGPAHEHIANLTADSWRLRAGLEASRRFALDGDAALEPFVEAAARRDGGDGLKGTGLEIAGGLRYTAPRLHIEMRGRWLASHSEEGAEESGVSVTARMGPGARGRGLSLSLSPRWGAGTGGRGGAVAGRVAGSGRSGWCGGHGRAHRLRVLLGAEWNERTADAVRRDGYFRHVRQ